MVRNNKVKVKSIHLMGSSAKTNISLWRDMTEVPFRAGDYVKITNVVVNTFRNETSLSTTSVTIVEVSNKQQYRNSNYIRAPAKFHTSIL